MREKGKAGQSGRKARKGRNKGKETREMGGIVR
jgi:hypothetical protein